MKLIFKKNEMVIRRNRYEFPINTPNNIIISTLQTKARRIKNIMNAIYRVHEIVMNEANNELHEESQHSILWNILNNYDQELYFKRDRLFGKEIEKINNTLEYYHFNQLDFEGLVRGDDFLINYYSNH